MICAWEAYKRLFPPWMQEKIDIYHTTIEETRLRIGECPVIITSEGNITLSLPITKEDIQFAINAASQYSPWTSESIQSGYMTAPGGHRIGICGQAVIENGHMTGIREPHSLSIRAAKDYPGIATPLKDIPGSILILGPPGRGKTTLMRDLIRVKSNFGYGPVSVIDEKCELFPFYQGTSIFPTGAQTDVLSGCPKCEGILNMLQAMGPKLIAMDEITAPKDAEALVHAGRCGVNILASAHASSKYDFENRPIYKSLCKQKLFCHLIILQKDRSWRLETLCNSLPTL